MSGLILKDGKFLRDGVEVRPQIGNAEQIALIKSHERAINQALKEGVKCQAFPADIRYTAVLQLVCLCGSIREIKKEDLYPADDTDIINDANEEFTDEIITCSKCGNRYRFDGDDAKLIDPKNNAIK